MSHQSSINEIREKFLNFFKEKEHAVIESAPLVTSDDKGVTDSTLFNTAGVQPLIPYLLGKKHPLGNRLASAQKCIRTIDIAEVGDETHLTFFEMLGNWSLGDYFKKESIKWSYEFLTDDKSGLGLDPERIYVTVFAGNDQAPKDNEALLEWKKYLSEDRIFFLESNWWEAGENGPCGPDTEIFYDLTDDGLEINSLKKFLEADNQSNIVEIWNNVFMQFKKENGKIVSKLPQASVDTGAGIERLTTVVNNFNDVYQLDQFKKTISYLNSINLDQPLHEVDQNIIKKYRIISDHIRAATFLISDGVIPSNTDRGYILRRLMRRSITLAHQLKIQSEKLANLFDVIIDEYADTYKNLDEKIVHDIYRKEERKFRKTLDKGLKELTKIIIKQKNIPGDIAFKLFTTYGFPIELIKEIASQNKLAVDEAGFQELMSKHQEKSKTASAGKFKGGLEQMNEKEIKYHTATHILHQVLREVLGEGVEQKGSNINSERLRFDFSFPQKLTEEEKALIEGKVNQIISQNIPVNKVELAKSQAVNLGAIHLFEQKYPDIVSVYYIGDSIENAYSKEFCGGPHVKNTSELGIFKIKKEEASSAGVRRIKAILE